MIDIKNISTNKSLRSVLEDQMMNKSTFEPKEEAFTWSSVDQVLLHYMILTWFKYSMC